MIFFGWGRKNKGFPVADGTTIVCLWTYVHVFWMPLTIHRKWTHMNAAGEEKRLTRDEVKMLYHSQIPDIGLWNRFGLLFPAAAMALFIFLDPR